MFSLLQKSSSLLLLRSSSASLSTPTRLALLRFAPSRPFSLSRSVNFENPSFSSDRVERVERESAPSTTLFVGNIPYSANETELKALFADFGDVEEVKLHRHDDGRLKGFAHVTFSSKETASEVKTSADEEPFHLANRDLVVNYAYAPKQRGDGGDRGDRRERTPFRRDSREPRERGDRERRPQRDFREEREPPSPSDRVYFANFKGGEDALRRLVEGTGNRVMDVFFLRDRATGEQKEVGFMEFMSTEASTKAIEALNGTDMEGGAKLHLAYARPKPERAERSERSSYGDRSSRY